MDLTQEGIPNYSSHLFIPVAMSISEAEYILAILKCMKASHLIPIDDLRFLGSLSYDGDDLQCEPSRIVVDNEGAISMVSYNTDTVGNIHVAKIYRYIREGTTLNEHFFSGLELKFNYLTFLQNQDMP